jgi:hypothetical protein
MSERCRRRHQCRRQRCHQIVLNVPMQLKRALATISIAASLSVGPNGPSGAEPLETIDDVGAALRACWNPPAGTSGSAVTLRFSFNRNGKLIGPPRATAIKVSGDDAARRTFVEAATKALEGCVPLSFSPALGAVIGGTVFTMQFTSPGY